VRRVSLIIWKFGDRSAFLVHDLAQGLLLRCGAADKSDQGRPVLFLLITGLEGKRSNALLKSFGLRLRKSHPKLDRGLTSVVPAWIPREV
jgi:hypothetical protein